jgi:hypothetical protein
MLTYMNIPMQDLSSREKMVLFPQKVMNLQSHRAPQSLQKKTKRSLGPNEDGNLPK